MIIFANNAVTTLADPLLDSQTTLTVLATTGELFPVPGVGEYFKLTLEDRRNRTIEITHCTGRAGDVLTIVRAQEDTIALDFAAGSTVANRFTRDSADAIIAQVPSPNPWYLGPFATAPTLDNEGGPLVAGMKYFNTTDNIEYTWNGSSWIDTMGGTSAITSLSGTYRLQDPSAGFDGVETDFNLRYIDYAAAVQTPDVTIAEQFLVFLDGVRLKPGTDYTIPVLGTIAFADAPTADQAFTGVWIALTAAGTQGIQGIQGNNGVGVPNGGTANQALTKIDGTDGNTQWTTIAVLTDGDKGDIVVSGVGTVWTIEDSSVTLAKMANIATGSILGRVTAATGVVEVLTPAQVKTLLALVKADVGLGNVDNTSDLNKPVSTAQEAALDLKANLNAPALTGVPTAPTAAPGTNTTQLATTAFVVAADAGKQPLDTDLTTIAGLTATTDNFIQSKSSAWASRTVAQVKTDLGLTGTNSGDNAAASATVSGIVELLTDAETQTGTDTTRAMTAANLTAKEAVAGGWRANTANRILTTDIVWGDAAEVTLTDAATIAVDMSTFLNAKVTLAGNRTLGQPSNIKVGQSGAIRIIQDGTGTRTLAYHADWKFAGGTDPVVSTSAGANDLLFYQVIATNFIYATLIKNLG